MTRPMMLSALLLSLILWTVCYILASTPGEHRAFQFLINWVVLVSSVCMPVARRGG